jgi:hypothetical protein
MAQPEGLDDGNFNLVWLLKKPLYGFKQAPRCWNKRITKFLNGFGFWVSESDPSVFIASCYTEMVYLIINVDDGLIISADMEILQKRS